MAKVNIKSKKITPFGGIYYTSSAHLLPSHAWHTFCHDTIFVGLTAQECAENQKTNCGCIFREFWRG